MRTETKPDGSRLSATTTEPRPAGRPDPLPPDVRLKRRWVLLVTVLGSALVVIDVTAMNVVAPQIQEGLQTSVGTVQWVIGAYTLFLASVTLTGGALADRYGRRRILALGITLFALASFACGLAPDAPTLILARAVQGLGGALLLPGSIALIGAEIPSPERGRALGIWASMTALTAVLGPVLGGILTDLGSWRWIFYVNVPIGLGLLVPLYARIPESRARTTGRLDLAGALLATLGLGAIVAGIIQGGVTDWAPRHSLLPIAAGLLLIAWFIRHERRTPHPMLPLRLFQSARFSGANLLTFFAFAALAAGMFFVPMRLILLEGHRPLAAGFAMVPTILLISLLSPRFGALAGRHPRTLLTLGPLIAAIGYVVLALPPTDTPYHQGILWGLVLVGFGMAMVMAPVTATVLSSVHDDHLGLASGVNNAVSRMGALLAIAASGAIAIAVFGHYLAPELDRIGLDDEAHDAAWANRDGLAAAKVPPGLDEADAQALRAAYDHAFLQAYRGVQLTMAASALTAAIIGATTLGRSALAERPPDPHPHEDRTR